MMDSYEPRNVSEQAHALTKPHQPKHGSNSSFGPSFDQSTTRCPQQNALSPARGKRDVKIDTKEVGLLFYGTHRIDVSQVEQLIDMGQTRSIGLMIHYFAQHYADNCENLTTGLKQVLEDAQQHGLDTFSQYKVGNLAMPRLHELAAAINRIREGSWRQDN
jgi:hypothetical protein